MKLNKNLLKKLVKESVRALETNHSGEYTVEENFSESGLKQDGQTYMTEADAPKTIEATIESLEQTLALLRQLQGSGAKQVPVGPMPPGTANLRTK